MYIWQLQFGLDYTIVGRTWDEYKQVIEKITNGLGEHEYVVFYVHNLSYEFQFLRTVHRFSEDDVFAVDSRKVLKCRAGHIEYRCSYLHSNMNLETYLNKMGAPHAKKTGQLDYTKIRYPYTELTPDEMEYCVNDVRGLVEALTIEMEHDNDTLYTIPLTSTGYVRRDVKNAMRRWGRTLAKDIAPDFTVYQLLREAFRGGNTHANRWFVGTTLKNVKSADRSSSYPDVLCNCLFPVKRFVLVENPTTDIVQELIEMRKKALLSRICLEGVRLRSESWGCPYLAKDKCRYLQGAVIDNGRIIEAVYLETTITDIDLSIILSEYDFDNIIFFDTFCSSYGRLPEPIIECNIEYYKRKTELKGMGGLELLYLKSKNKLNSIYGMMAQNPVKQSIIFNGTDFELDISQDKETLLDKANRKAFLSYQWGVWCTAWARLRLEEGIRLAGDGFIYADTDSVKYIGDIDFTGYNNERIRDSEKSGAFAKDPSGTMHHMGVYEYEGEYTEFKTWGAKKYAYRDTKGKLHCVISGVSKRDGGPELERAGGLSAFKPGFVFRDAGGTESVYNDIENRTVIMPNGEPLKLGPNVLIKDSTYTLGLSAEYERLLDFRENHKYFDFSIDI